MDFLYSLKLVKQALLFIKDGAKARFHGKLNSQPQINNDPRLNISSEASISATTELNLDELSNDTTSSITIGKHVWLAKNVEVQVWKNTKVEIKDYSTIQENCKIYGDVTIEKYCVFSLNCFLSSGNHYATVKPSWLIRDQDDFVLSSKEGFNNHSKAIHIEEDCWIGWGVFIKQGITVGRGAVIGAYSVVTKDVLPYSINAGQPAKKIKQRLNFSPLSEIDALTDDHLPYFYRGFMHKQFEIKESRKEKIIYAENEVYVVMNKMETDSLIKISGKCFDSSKMANDIKIEINQFESFVYNIKSTTFDLEFKLQKSNGASIDLPYFLQEFHYIKISNTCSLKSKWGISKVSIS